ncbi:hypothetical protein GCM10025868_44160 [Angustibacter aerolatus]|uniref:ROK family protein n=1 Tax=Angustibacter aerolatus TaxID=1162965 RepID=A0ABQ6JR56_9ACTN|nr:hypothetical protein GCM10025868_44160 [Angustibacter aerolatus]
MQAGALAVMTSHVLLPALDPLLPATLSPTVLGLLRADPGRAGWASTACWSATPSTCAGPAAAGASPRRPCSPSRPASTCCASAPTRTSSLHLDVVAALEAAVHDGSLPAERLLDAARRVDVAADEVARLRRAAEPPSADTTSSARAAAAAVRVQGDLPDLAGALVVRVRTGTNVAVGEVPWGLPDPSALPDVLRLDVDERTDADQVLAAAGDARWWCWCASSTATRGWGRSSTGSPLRVPTWWPSRWAGPGRTSCRGCRGAHLRRLAGERRRARRRPVRRVAQGAPVSTDVPARPGPVLGHGPDPAGVPWRAGLDVGGSKVLGVALDDADRVLGSVRLPTEAGPAGVLRSAAAAVAALAAERPASAPLRAVGVGVPGVVPPGSGSVRHAVNLGLTDEVFDLGPALAERVGAAVTVENDVNAAALGAAHQARAARPGAAQHRHRAGGRPGRRRPGAPRIARRGGGGGARAGRSARAALRLRAARLSRAGSPRARPSPRPGRCPADAARPSSLFAAAAAGDERARRVRDDWSAAVAAAVRLLVLTADVEVVVLGGGVSDVGPPLLEAVSGALAAQATGSAFLTSLDLPRRVVLLPAGSTAAAVGAAIAADLVAAGRA